jgi:hypothetical protein
MFCEALGNSTLMVRVVVRLKCGQIECVGEATGNTVKSIQNDHGKRRRGSRHRVEAEYYQIFLWSGASEETEFFTKRLVTNEK